MISVYLLLDYRDVEMAFRQAVMAARSVEMVIRGSKLIAVIFYDIIWHVKLNTECPNRSAMF